MLNCVDSIKSFGSGKYIVPCVLREVKVGVVLLNSCTF